jgi:hypothetical protein
MNKGSGNLPQVFCRGEPRDMGRQQGAALRDRILALRGDLVRLEPFRLRQPVWLPYGVYRWLAERRAGRHLARALPCNDPGMGERLSGIAEGAGIGHGAICLFNALEPLLSSVGDCITCGHGCSAVAIRGGRSAAGEPVIARNFDYLPLAQPYYIVRETRPAHGLRSLEFTIAPLAGAVDGLNEAGLCVVYDYAFALDQPAAPAPSISMAISGALARCRTVAEAAEYFAMRPRWGAALLMLADAAGDIASLELSSTRSQLRRPQSGEDCCFHTNRFQTAEMQGVQTPPDAVLDHRAPAALRGSRVHESAERRDARFQQLLADRTPLGLEGLAALMADHGPDGQPCAFTPCVHSDYWNTTACAQWLPRSRRLRIAFDAACQARYQEFGF